MAGACIPTPGLRVKLASPRPPAASGGKWSGNDVSSGAVPAGRRRRAWGCTTAGAAPRYFPSFLAVPLA